MAGRGFHRARPSQSIVSALSASSAQDNFLVGKDLSPALYQEESSPFLSFLSSCHILIISSSSLSLSIALSLGSAVSISFKKNLSLYPTIEANSDFRSCYNPWYLFAVHIVFTEKKSLSDAVVHGMFLFPRRDTSCPATSAQWLLSKLMKSLIHPYFWMSWDVAPHLTWLWNPIYSTKLDLILQTIILSVPSTPALLEKWCIHAYSFSTGSLGFPFKLTASKIVTYSFLHPESFL